MYHSADDQLGEQRVNQLPEHLTNGEFQRFLLGYDLSLQMGYSNNENVQSIFNGLKKEKNENKQCIPDEMEKENHLGWEMKNTIGPDSLLPREEKNGKKYGTIFLESFNQFQSFFHSLCKDTLICKANCFQQHQAAMTPFVS